jgi:putative membrane protein
MMNGMSDGMGLWGLVMSLTMLAALALTVLGAVWLYQRLTITHTDATAIPIGPSGDAAQTRLRERYASGEIDDEEFERRLSALKYWR